MSHRFDTDTAVWPETEGGFETRIDPGGWVVADPNGGEIWTRDGVLIAQSRQLALLR